jgi:small subunit ribosomal protein S13
VVSMGISKVKEEEKEEKPKKVERKEEKPAKSIKSVVRVANTDLDGEKRLDYALVGIKGIGFTMAKAICRAVGLNPKVKLSSLSESEIQKLEDAIFNPSKYGIPSFLFNRRRDLETGKDLHLVGSDLEIAKKFDIERYITLKTYRGWRHMLGQPVRGQSTRSHFRERGKVVGVSKKKIQIKSEKKEEKK